MKKDSSIRWLSGSVAAAASALCLATVGAAAAQTPTSDVSITVFADHYVLAGRLIDDLDALEDAVSAMRPRTVTIDACGAGTARAQRAAAHRFRNLYLDLRVVETNAPSCQAAITPRAVPVSQRTGQRPFGIYDEAVDRWWNNVMP
jgi:hypothetical protein